MSQALFQEHRMVVLQALFQGHTISRPATAIPSGVLYGSTPRQPLPFLLTAIIILTFRINANLSELQEKM